MPMQMWNRRVSVWPFCLCRDCYENNGLYHSLQLETMFNINSFLNRTLVSVRFLWRKCRSRSVWLVTYQYVCLVKTVQQGSGQSVWECAGGPAGHHAAGAGRQRQPHQLRQLRSWKYRLWSLPGGGDLCVCVPTIPFLPSGDQKQVPTR